MPSTAHFILDLGKDKAVRHQRQNSCPTHPLFLFLTRVNKYPAPPLFSFTIQSHRLCFFNLSSKWPVSTTLRSLLFHWKLRRQYLSSEAIIKSESLHWSTMRRAISDHHQINSIPSKPHWILDNANSFSCFRLHQHRSYVSPYFRPSMRRTQEQPRAGTNPYPHENLLLETAIGHVEKMHNLTRDAFLQQNNSLTSTTTPSTATAAG
jgi:hypothetical protein